MKSFLTFLALAVMLSASAQTAKMVYMPQPNTGNRIADLQIQVTELKKIVANLNQECYDLAVAGKAALRYSQATSNTVDSLIKVLHHREPNRIGYLYMQSGFDWPPPTWAPVDDSMKRYFHL